MLSAFSNELFAFLNYFQLRHDNSTFVKRKNIGIINVYWLSYSKSETERHAVFMLFS